MSKNYEYKDVVSEYTNYIYFLESKYKEYYKKARKSILRKNWKWYYNKSLEIHNQLLKVYSDYIEFVEKEQNIKRLEKEIDILIKKKNKTNK